MNEFVNNYTNAKNYTENNQVVNRADSVVNRTDNATTYRNFVEKIVHQVVKPIQQPNYEKIKQVNEIKISQDSKLAALVDEQNKLLKENNNLHKETQRTLRAMGMSVNLDKNGFAVSFMEVVEQNNINKRL